MVCSVLVTPLPGIDVSLIKWVHELVLNIKYSNGFKSPESAIWISPVSNYISHSPLKMSKRRFLLQLAGSPVIASLVPMERWIEDTRQTWGLQAHVLSSWPCAAPCRNINNICVCWQRYVLNWTRNGVPEKTPSAWLWILLGVMNWKA